MTDNEVLVKKTIETITSRIKRPERLSWARKMDVMVSLLAQIQPIEQQLSELEAQRREIGDLIDQQRQTMLENCIHPAEMLVAHSDNFRGPYVECKFCGIRFAIKQNISSNITTDEKDDDSGSETESA